MSKGELRQELRQHLLAIPSAIREEKQNSLSVLLSSLVRQISSENKFTRLGVFSPLTDEPLWWSCFASDLTWLAVHMRDSKTLEFFPVDENQYCRMKGVLKLDLSQGLNADTPEILLVPGLGFTREGERLGRGKGYYDRFLETFSGVSIGVFFSESECESVFSEEHDKKLDFIVTEKEVLKIKE